MMTAWLIVGGYTAAAITLSGWVLRRRHHDFSQASTCDHTPSGHALSGCPDIGMPPMSEDKTAQILGIVPTQAEHIASLTSMLKEFYWQGMTDAGSQALAMQLYERGARAPQGHTHVCTGEFTPTDDEALRR